MLQTPPRREFAVSAGARGAARDSAGLLAPVDSAAPGASEDCIVHSSVPSSSCRSKCVQFEVCGPNPCFPCSGMAGEQVTQLRGIRSLSTSASVEAAKLAGRCVRFSDVRWGEPLDTCSTLWLQASRAVRRLVTSGPQHLGVSFPDTGCATHTEDESCPPAASNIARRGVSPNLAERFLAGTGLSSSVGARVEQRDVSFLSAFSGQLSQAFDVTPARLQFYPGSVGQQEAGLPFANVERLLCVEDESFPPARCSSTCLGISSLPASLSPPGKGPASLVVSITTQKDESFPSGSIGQHFPDQSMAGPLSSTCDGSAVIAAEGGALHAPAQRCVGEALPRAFLPYHREQCQQADATSTVAPQEDESFPPTVHCCQRHPAAGIDCLVPGRTRPAGPAGTDAGPGRVPRSEVHASHPLPGHEVSQREQDEIS